MHLVWIEDKFVNLDQATTILYKSIGGMSRVIISFSANDLFYVEGDNADMLAAYLKKISYHISLAIKEEGINK